MFGERKRDSNYGIDNQQGCAVLEAVLANPHSQVMVSCEALANNNGTSLAVEEQPKQPRAKATLTLAQQVQKIWSKVLEIDDISLKDDFFALGGDSLTAIQLSYQVKQELGIKVSPDILLQCSVLENFIAKVEQLLAC